MNYFTYFPPAPELADYIAFYGIHDRPAGIPETYLSPPLGFCGFMFTLEGTGVATINGANFVRHVHSATGQVTAPVVGEMLGKFKSLLVFIHPLGLYQFFGCDMSALTNSSIPLSELLGEEAYQTLLHQILSADSDEAQIHILNTFFLARQHLFDVALPVKKALDYIHARQGNITIQDLVKESFATRRTLERHFQQYVGISPKVYANIIRFKNFMNDMQEHPGKTWSELCDENGFYDHSHLTRYFTEYLHAKPHELVNLDRDFINFLLQE
jgi:AraC-like DNA-binding protein